MQCKFGVMVGVTALGFVGILSVGSSAAAGESTRMISRADVAS
jgi:hypothetical protein